MRQLVGRKGARLRGVPGVDARPAEIFERQIFAVLHFYSRSGLQRVGSIDVGYRGKAVDLESRGLNLHLDHERPLPRLGPISSGLAVFFPTHLT